MKTPPCPPIDKALLDHLNALYRQEIEVPQKETSGWDIGERAGKKHVLAYLERKYREQNKQAPVPNVLQQTEDP